jgi:hypothetical protein
LVAVILLLSVALFFVGLMIWKSRQGSPEPGPTAAAVAESKYQGSRRRVTERKATHPLDVLARKAAAENATLPPGDSSPCLLGRTSERSLSAHSLTHRSPSAMQTL